MYVMHLPALRASCSVRRRAWHRPRPPYGGFARL